ncbi:hypothetical protein HHI36_017390 [Cryptolaemus montrouzieri]|uniref:Coil containing protein n=1 Tax=Cryptolaemus montrouzieri TaxID=559131 RepID=A0ABD2NMU3_9CUCU
MKLFLTLHQESIDTAKEEAMTQNSGDRDIVAAFDRSWQKRGHTSLNGFCKKDIRRMKKARNAALEMSKEARQQRARALKRLEDHWKEQEGGNPSYAPGAH